MPNEVEVKFKVEDLEAMRQRVIAAGGELVASVLQTDTFFDTPTGDLRRSDRGLRLRRFDDVSPPNADARALLTHKGPRQPNAAAKTRREVQTRVDDADAVAEMLVSLGFVEAMVVQKRRSSYRLGRCTIELDQVPMIGCFVEIEADNESDIDAARRQLDLSGQAITDAYTHLLVEHCRRKGLPTGRIVF